MRKFINIVESVLNQHERDRERTHLTSHNQIMNNPAFRQWFGESKVVSDSGLPLVCFHGTSEQFTRFQHKSENRRSYGFDNLGFWFDVHADTASYFAGQDGYATKTGSVMPVFLKIQKPLVLNSEYLWGWDRDDYAEKYAVWKTLSQQHMRARRDEFGNPRNPDGSIFDTNQYRAAERAMQAAEKTVLGDRSDGFDRMMKLLPNGAKSTEDEVLAFKAEVIGEGYDGIHLEGTTADWGTRGHRASDWWLAFKPNQIKSIWSKEFTDSDHIHETHDGN